MPAEADAELGTLKRAALFNLLGAIAKLLEPLALLSIPWLWGIAMVGPYALGLSLLEIAAGLIAAGYGDATTIFASRHVDSARTDPVERERLYRVLANALLAPLLVSALTSALALAFARPFMAALFPNFSELLPGLYFLALSLVPRSLSAVAVAATKATLHMEHDAFINGLLRPLAGLLGFGAVYAAGGGLTGLFAVQLVVETALLAFALPAFARYFSARDVWRALRRFEADRRLLRFALPQSLNLTFNRYIARLAGLMLAYFGVNELELGYFATASLLTGSLSQVRIVFSSALGPLVARYHARGERENFAEVMSRVSRWTTTIVVPVVLVCLVLRRDILQLVSPEYGADSLFVALLLIPPFASCAFGLAGACLMFSGHSQVTLLNSFAVALLNTLFTALLIPRYGLLGAAGATALASSLITLLQMIELRWLEGVTIRARAVWKPHAGLALGLGVLALRWDPVDGPPLERALTAAGLLAGYTLLMLALGHEELNGILDWGQRCLGRAAGAPLKR
jgi:stage V sporulation protein B